MLTGKNIIHYYAALFLALLTCCHVHSQQNDAVRDGSFILSEGKGIRHILIREFGFDRIFIDTTKQIDYFGKDLVKHLHRNTKEWVIRNNLFIKEKTAFSANLVADNERFLRSLDYIHDARILVNPVPNEPDSVDVLVITKDFLSITFQVNNATAKRFKSKIGDANVLGTGQNVQVATLFEEKRNHHFGYEILYRNNSIANTFLNATIEYSNITHNLGNRVLDEETWHTEIEKPLASQYMHVAGGMKFAHGQTHNRYSRADSLFYNYAYNTFDVWLGYNLGVRKFLFLKSVLNRQFVSLRYFRNKFTEAPYQVGDKFNFSLNDRESLLAQFTFFRQNFYKTNYVIGFGITEDIPYGYNISLTGGWYKQLHLERAYAGADANLYVVTRRGNVIQYFLRAGAYLDKGNIQDAVTLAGASSFSRIYSYKNLKMRQYFRFSYTRQFNRIGLDPLGINNVFGLPYISLDSANGRQRGNLHTETVFFIKYRLLGFKFALFASADFAFFTPEQQKTANTGFYSGFGGGMRTRNENILFNTVELRFMYFPRKSFQHNAFKLTVNTNLRFRYSNTYVKAPDIIQLNSDYNQNIY